MTFLQIKYFVETAKENSYTRTAKNLFVSQQAVNKQIKALEQELGFKLFESEGKKLRLTEGGRKLFALWEPMLRQTEDVIRETRKNQNQKETILRIGLLEYEKIKEMVLPWLIEFGEEYPRVRMEITAASPAKLRTMAEDSETDLLCTLSSELPRSCKNHEMVTVKPLELSIILAQSHPLAKKDILNIEDLKDETIFIFSNSHSEDAQKQILSHFREKGFVPEVKFFRSQESMEVELMMGKGITTGFGDVFKNAGGRLKFYPMPYRKKGVPARVVLIGVTSLGCAAVRKIQKSQQKGCE